MSTENDVINSFWKNAREAAEEVASWPSWKKRFLELALAETKSYKREPMKQIKIYKLNDCDWIAASTLEEAIDCIKMHYYYLDAAEDMLDNPCELTDEQLEAHTFITDRNETISFKQELTNRISRNEVFPQFFASTEY